MVELEKKKVIRAKRGEILSYVFLAIAGTGVVFFAVTYPIARVQDIDALLILSYVLSPIFVAGGAIGSALFNFTYGAEGDRLIKNYVRDVCLENPQAMHPERESLTFYIEFDKCKFLMHANGYSEKLVFDFSPFKRLSPMRKSLIANVISDTLILSFCRMYDRGAKYSDVGYMMAYGRKKSKLVPIILGGVPDKKSYRIYLKLRIEN